MDRDRVQLATDLIPIGEFRSRTAKILSALAEDGRARVITQNGRAAAVVMSPAEYDALRARHQLIEDVARGIDDAAAGRTQTTVQLRKSLRRRRKEP